MPEPDQPVQYAQITQRARVLGQCTDKRRNVPSASQFRSRGRVLSGPRALAAPAAEELLHMEVRTEETGTVLVLSGEIDMSVRERLELVATGLLRLGGRLVLDLTRIVFMDSSGVRVLVKTSLHARMAGVDLSILVSSQAAATLQSARVIGDLPVVRPARAVSAAVPPNA